MAPANTPEFHNIISYAERNHKPHCQCGFNPTDFQSHGYVNQTVVDKPTTTVSSEHSPSHKQFLLLHSLPDSISANDWRSTAKNHFLILAQKYHPDKNEAIYQEQCHTAMTHLNESYKEVLQKYHFQDNMHDVVMKDNKIYQKINHCTITCQHQTSFSIYGYPDDVNQWKTKFKQLWKCSPKPIKSKSKRIGHQFGNDTESLYINLFDNGTIHIQGIMALQYSEEFIGPLFQQWFKLSSTSTDRKRFSDLLKKSLALFRNEISNSASYQMPSSLTTTKSNLKQLASTTEEASSFAIEDPDTPLPQLAGGLSLHQNEPHDDRSMIQKLSARLDQALTRIGDLEEAASQLVSKEQLNNALTRIAILESNIVELTTANKQLKEQTGPKFAQLTKKIDQLTHLTPMPIQSTSTTKASFADHASKLNQKSNNIQPKSSITKFATSRIEFDRSKCVVLDKIQNNDEIKSDDCIRRIIGKDKNIVIDRISRAHTGQIFVQLSDPEAVDKVITNWDPKTFGHSTVYRSKKPQRRYGVLKGIPLNLSDDEIKDDLTDLGFIDTVVDRILQQHKPTRAVKVRFQSEDDLRQAIRSNVVIQHLTTRVELLSVSPRVTQCFNCQKFGHIADKCRLPKACIKCSKPYDESHEECNNAERCVNCQGNHASIYKQCPKFIERFNLQKQKMDNLFDEKL